MFSNKKILLIAPHTDDIEFGCGGTVAKLLEEGNELFYVAFSSCMQSVPIDYPYDILVTELKNSTARLGIKPDNLILLDYEVRIFNFKRQEILDDLIKLRNRINPDLVFIPSSMDVHQDHATISNECVRAFKNTSILCYELPWNNFVFNTTCFFKLEERHLQRKIDAVYEYKSQQHRTYVNEEFIRSLARVRGVQAGSEYAETFEVKRWII